MFSTKTVTVDKVTELVTNYKNGNITLTSIAMELGCSVPTAARLLKKEGVVMRGKGRPKGSKTVNRKPKVVTFKQVVNPEVNDTLPVSDKKLLVDSGDFAAFQKRVLNYAK